jgi:hypothetical protein
MSAGDVSGQALRRDRLERARPHADRIENAALHVSGKACAAEIFDELLDDHVAAAGVSRWPGLFAHFDARRFGLRRAVEDGAERRNRLAAFEEAGKPGHVDAGRMRKKLLKRNRLCRHFGGEGKAPAA